MRFGEKIIFNILENLKFNQVYFEAHFSAFLKHHFGYKSGNNK